MQKIKNGRVSLRFFLVSIILALVAGWAFSFLVPVRNIFSPRTGVAGIGEVFRSGPFEITVHGVRYDSVGDEVFRLPSGFRFVIADMTFRNVTAQPAEFAPLLHILAKDSAERVYPVEPIPTPYGQWSGRLSGNDSVRQEIGFVLPETESRIRLYFETGTPERNVIVVSVP